MICRMCLILITNYELAFGAIFASFLLVLIRDMAKYMAQLRWLIDRPQLVISNS